MITGEISRLASGLLYFIRILTQLGDLLRELCGRKQVLLGGTERHHCRKLGFGMACSTAGYLRFAHAAVEFNCGI